MQILYTTQVTSTGGGRVGSSKTDDGRLDVTLAKPAELGGDGNGTNPEQLFASGYSACFLGAMHFSAAQQKVELSADVKVNASVSLGKRDDGEGFAISVQLSVSDTGLDAVAAQAVIDQAHIVCPYSHATQGNISITTELV